MDDVEQVEVWALAIHAALTASDEAGRLPHTTGHSRIDRCDGKPQSGWVDGDMYGLAAALRNAGWRPPDGVLDAWNRELARWPKPSRAGVAHSSAPLISGPLDTAPEPGRLDRDVLLYGPRDDTQSLEP